jgi:SAM-dependent methyltransferase
MWNEVFDDAAHDYDDPALRFFDLGAEALLERTVIGAADRVLDVATGTGKVAAHVRATHGRARVIGVDRSPAMLRRAAERDEGIALAVADARRLPFASKRFHAVLCGFGITFLRPRIVPGLREQVRVLRPGGVLGVTTPGRGAFEPVLSLALDALAGVGVPRPPAPDDTWTSLDRPAHVAEALRRAGLRRVHAEQVEIAYRLDDPEQGWRLLSGTAWRGAVRALAPELRARVHDELVAALAEVHRAGGIDLVAPLIVATGRRPRLALRGRRRPGRPGTVRGDG